MSGTATTIPWPPAAAAHRAPAAVALVDASQTMTYRDLDRWVEGTAARLQAMGLGRGTRVATLLGNTWEHVVLLLAVMRGGGVACPLSTRLPAQAVRVALERIEAAVLIAKDDAHAHAGGSAATCAPDDVLRQTDEPLPDVPSLKASQPAAIVFTSGSTGRPSAALLSFGNLCFNALGSNQNMGLHAGDRWLASLPLYHVGGLGVVMRCVLAGATIVMPDDGPSLCDTVRRRSITHLSVVPTQLRRFLDDPACDVAGLKAVLAGGSALPPSLIDRAVDAGLPLYTTYGCTEMASQVTTTPPDASRTALHTSGRRLPFREIRIDDGEIHVRGATRFLGYVEGHALHRPFTDDGWYATGDLGEVDGRGFLTVDGRKDNLFISGGENIQPEEIERALLGLAGVERVVVVPVVDETFGHRPAAFVAFSETPRSPRDLRAHLEETLPRFKIPFRFFPWPEQGKEGRMKVDRAEMARLAYEWSKTNDTETSETS